MCNICLLQNSNREGGIIVKNHVICFKSIRVNKFIFYLDLQGECFFDSRLLKYFDLIYNCSAFGCGKKFEKCLFIGWTVAVFILLADILIVRLIYSSTM